MHPTPKPYRFADEASGFLLIAAVLFAPWAFGTTLGWTVLAMNGVGYALGLLLAFKGFVRWKADFQPSRWTDGAGHRWPVRTLAALTGILLSYVLISALNARARMTYTFAMPGDTGSGIDIEYLEAIEWLPHSYDRATTLGAFYNYLAIACFFWAARDWLLGMSRKERRMSDADRLLSGVPPRRISVLLWTVVLSAAALSIVGTLQRLDGSRNLLWILPNRNPPSVTFGPFAYRGTASDYLNLAWPIGLAFWWALRQRFLRVSGSAARAGASPHVVLLPLVAVIALGPFIAASRGGLLVELAILPICVAIVWSSGRLKRGAKITLLFSLLVAGGVGWQLGGKQLQERFKTLGDDKMSGRESIYENGAKMVSDFAPFGSGAETFPKLYYLYRSEVDQRWEAYAHDDYLEILIGFGWVGFALILAALVSVPLCSQFGSGIPIGRTFHLLWITALGGAMLHARFDPTFQVYSIHVTFLILCAALSCFTTAKE